MSYRTRCGIFVFHFIDCQEVIATVKNGDSYNHCNLILFQSSLLIISKIINSSILYTHKSPTHAPFLIFLIVVSMPIANQYSYRLFPK